MGYDDYEEYEYEDDEEYYYEDDEEYIDYTEDVDDESEGSSIRGSVRPFGSGTGSSGGLPGSSSSGSRFGGSGLSSRFSSSKSDDDDKTSSSGSRFGGSGSSSRFSSSKSDDDDKSSSSGSRFGGSSSSSRFGGSSSKSDDDDKTSSSGSRFGGSSSSSRFGSSSKSDDDKSSSSSSRFGGGSSSRFGSSKSDDDDKSSSSGSRFGGSGSSSRFGSSGSSSRFSSSKSDDDDKTSSSGSRFGGSSSSSRFGSSSKSDDDKSSSSSSRFGGSRSSSRFGSSSSKSDSKKDDDSGGGVFGNIRNRLSGGSSDDKKDGKKDGDSGGGVLGAVTGLFGGSSDDKKDGKKDSDTGGGVLGAVTGLFGGSSDDKKDDKSSSSSSRFGSSSSRSGNRFGQSSSSSSKSDDKRSSSSSGSRFGRFGGGSKSDDKKDDKKSSRQSPFGSKKSGDDKDNKGAKTAASTAKAESSGGVFGRIKSALSFGSRDDDSSRQSRTASKKSRTPKVPKASSSDGLTLDNWLDIIGVGLVVISLVLFFSGISQEQAAIAAIHTSIGQLFGWGAMAVPITMFVIGVWLIIRHFGDEAPTVDPIRLVGVAIIFVSTLVLFQYIDTFTYVLPNNVDNPELLREFLRARLNVAWEIDHSGGGLIGAELYFFLYTTVTEIGGFLLLIFAYTLGAMFLTRMSAAEIVKAIAGFVLAIRENMKQRAVRKRAERQLAALHAAEEQAGIAPQPQLATATAGAATDSSGREIRMTVGGYAETVSMSGQQNGQPQQAQAAYGPAMQAMPMQGTQAQSNNSGGSGFLSRFRGGSSDNNEGNSFSLFGRNNDDGSTKPPPPPANLPATPLPMDDGFSHFDAGPLRSVRPAAEQPRRLGDMLRDEQPVAEAQDEQTTGRASQQQSPKTDEKSQTASATADGETSQETEDKEEVNDFLKQRQDRLDKLRKGEIGPISQSALARAKNDDVSAAYVPSNEGQRETEFTQKFGTGIGKAVRDEAQQNQASDGDSESFTPPSKLPSVQADGETGPKQQMLSVPVDKPKSSEVKSNIVRPDWKLPDYRTLLSSGSDQEFDKEYLLKQASTIEETLEAFGAPGRVVEINTGPVITQFGVEPDYISGRGGRKQRVKVSAIAGLDKDLQLALGARSIRVEAPVPGKGYVGVEVPNAESTLVSLRDVMDSPGFAKHQSPLAIALGQSVSGAPISADLATMPHLLIAGTTGSGKSVCVNSIIASIISRNTPEQVKFIMVDPKRVELTGYNGIPHLVAPVVVELERIVGVLKWVTREMDARYKQFSDAGSRNIDDFNKHRDPKTTEQMPYLIVIIDELADLMMLAPEETERTVTRIAALARATGIHLVIATQRPSVDVVTGLIKANFPARIAFAVAGSVDSRVILDQPGAERLLGKGDMLWLSGDSPAPLRLQGVFVSDMEINNIVRYWKMQGLKQPNTSSNTTLAPKIGVEEPKAVQSSSNRLNNSSHSNDDLPLFASAKQDESTSNDSDDGDDAELTRRELTGDVKEGNEDELYDKAVELVRRLDKASISLLQRRLRIGYTRAARLIDVMEARGVVGPSKDGSSKPRDVLPED